jgi:hypothetical protein
MRSELDELAARASRARLDAECLWREREELLARSRILMQAIERAAYSARRLHLQTEWLLQLARKHLRQAERLKADLRKT